MTVCIWTLLACWVDEARTACLVLVFCAHSDRYFQMGTAGDACVVVGLNPNLKKSTVLPPMFKDGLDDDQEACIDQAVSEVFAGCLNCPGADTPQFRAVLRRCLARMIHSHEWLFLKCPAARNSGLFEVLHAHPELKQFVFSGYKDTPDCPVRAEPRGIPPALQIAESLKDTDRMA